VVRHGGMRPQEQVLMLDWSLSTMAGSRISDAKRSRPQYSWERLCGCFIGVTS